MDWAHAAEGSAPDMRLSEPEVLWNRIDRPTWCGCT
jgi:hypothetical protein